jgi:chlorobactene glucosyltransferase
VAQFPIVEGNSEMLWLWILYSVFIVGVLVWGGVIGARFKNTLTREKLPVGELPTVSTIVPARNEQRNIDRCARGITGQDYPNMDTIFVDDDSKDATPDILARYVAKDSRVKVVHTGGKPEGWNGKQWACHSGALEANGEWLCFMDADTYAEPFLISRTLAFVLTNNIDMLTLQPWYELLGLWERIILPTGLPHLLIVYPPDRVNNPNDPLSMANGQFILIKRSVYEAVKGHEGIKDRMMDDYSLGENVKNAGYHINIVDGAEVMRVRLYTNLREIWAGALKAAVQISGGWGISAVGLLVTLLVNVVPVFALWLAVLLENWPAVLIMGVTILIEIAYYSIVRMAGFRTPPWTGFVFPLGGLIVTMILADGMFRLATGREILWKGRSLLGKPELPTSKVNA